MWTCTSLSFLEKQVTIPCWLVEGIKKKQLTLNMSKRIIQSHEEWHNVFHLAIRGQIFNTTTGAFATGTNTPEITEFFPKFLQVCEVYTHKLLILDMIKQFSTSWNIRGPLYCWNRSWRSILISWAELEKIMIAKIPFDNEFRIQEITMFVLRI